MYKSTAYNISYDYCTCSVYVFSLSSTKPEHKVESRLLLDVVVGEGAAILKLFSSKDQSLLIWWNALLVLDLGLHILDRIRGLDLESDGLASQGLHKDLHTSTKSQNEMKGSSIISNIIVVRSI